MILAPELLGPACRYRAIARQGGGIVDTSLHFDKRFKAFHRFTIADTRGPLDVTIPVAKPASHTTATYADILISGHSPWWQTMMTALESAYGRTPFFEFYADDFLPLLNPDRVGTPMATLSADLDNLVCRLLSIPAPTYTSDSPLLPTDCERITPTATLASKYTIAEPYWQVRAQTLGFIPGLSILDLIFNLGPEATLLLT
ncbi:MAG: WbqC family protein [Candidatus Amulumruptor caecigallinarius]|nr:WbqC family protein [Candidatus Amulumruptor caecigallinarius]MCM1397649.1 WbqC family protein [Candidatus Amulumruptor caecigallinarius]MCM1454671.1 WbqC family protein [bacterium]